LTSAYILAITVSIADLPRSTCTYQFLLGHVPATLNSTIIRSPFNFGCRAVITGRLFCKRLINATNGQFKPCHRVRPSNDVKYFRKCLRYVCIPDRYRVSDAKTQFFTNEPGSLDLRFWHWCPNGPMYSRYGGYHATLFFLIVVASFLPGSELHSMETLFVITRLSFLF
jgi:hypothetical protein